MTGKKPERPSFQGVEIDDDIDARLEKKASEKGIPTLVAPGRNIGEMQTGSMTKEEGSKQSETTPRSSMKTLNIDLPDYLWVDLKMQAAQKMISVRYLVMTMLRDNGFEIKECDMVEDGRRLRGKNSV